MLNWGLESFGTWHRKSDCFTGSGVVEVVLPGTLKALLYDTLGRCRWLRTIWAEEGCPRISKRKFWRARVVAIPGRQTTVGGRPLWDLRALRDVEIPAGVEVIGDRWFVCSQIESVTIPASVREIGAEAFCDC